MKKILLVDVDSKIPNIVLGKLSTYWKQKGYAVVYYHCGFRGYPNTKRRINIDAKEYKKVFVSNIFTCNQDKFKILNCDDVSIGGVGSKFWNKRLPEIIEHSEVDYNHWPDNDKSYGFITRGCIRKCKFCYVPKCEGYIRKERDIDDIVKHDTVIFLDNNILAYEKHIDVLKEIRDKKILCQFNQGLDIRLLNDENMEVLSKIRYYEKYIFAFDDIHYEKAVERGIEIFKKYIPGDWRMELLIYYNAEEPLSDLLHRVEFSLKNKVLPFIMKDKNCYLSYYRDFINAYVTYINTTIVTGQHSTFHSFLIKWRNSDKMKNIFDVYRQIKKGVIK